MADTARTVSALWIGGSMSPYEHLCLSSFAHGGYDVQLFSYDPELVVPEGVHRCDAREVLPESSVFENHRERGTYAGFSNIFRYRLLQLEDTTWIDTDVMLVGESLPAGSYLFGYEDPGYVNSAVLRAPSDSGFLAHLYDTSIAVDHTRMTWGEIGPRLVTETITLFDLHHLVQPIEVLYPIHYREVGMLFDPSRREEVDERLGGACTLHLWNEIMRRGGPVKQVRPPQGSWFAEAFDAHGVDFGSRFEHDVTWVCDAVDLSRLTPEAAVAQRDAANAKRDAAVTERDAAVAARKAAVEQRDAAIAERDAAIAERDALARPFGWLRQRVGRGS